MSDRFRLAVTIGLSAAFAGLTASVLMLLLLERKKEQ